MKQYPDKSLKVDHRPEAGEKAPPYACHMTFEAVPPVGLLSAMGPFLNADVTNPRELYAILSDSAKQAQGSGVAASVGASAQQTLKLPPLQSSTSSETPFRPLKEQTQHSSYPDLSSLQRQQGASSQLDSVRRSTSLQDVSSLHKIDGLLTSKKLTPILRGCDSKSPRDPQEKGEDQAEAQLTKDRPLPPIEGKGDSSLDAGRQRHGSEVGVHHSPPSHRQSVERPRYIFPRGQPTQVKKPLTPTYDDYPEAYWELRSPTLQEPSDLKEDMIDRDLYRLQQISMHHLRAMNRDVLISKMDSYRKWQQNLQEHLPPLALGNKLDPSRGPGVWPGPRGGPQMSDRSWRPHRTPVLVPSHTLTLTVTTVSPPNNPDVKKQSDRVKNAQLETAQQSSVPTARDAEQQRSQVAEGEKDSQQQQEELKETDGEQETQQQAKRPKPDNRPKNTDRQEEGRPLKASVVNLYMDVSPQSNMAISDTPLVQRKTHNVRRPKSVTVGPQQPEQDFPHHQYGQDGDPQRLMSATSNAGTASSSLSHYLQRLPSAPAATPPPTLRTIHDAQHAKTREKNAGSKLILNKFNRLQVFGEKGQAKGSNSEIPWYTANVTSRRRKPYLPQNRPPTYRLDLRNYPPRPPGSGDPDLTAREVRVNMEGGGYPILVSERGGMPIAQQSSEQVDPSALSFRFRDGEVIVSRQGKKTHPT